MDDADEYDQYLEDECLKEFNYLSLDQIPPGADMTIMPYGKSETQGGKSIVYVVWEGRKRGLFYSW